MHWNVYLSGEIHTAWLDVIVLRVRLRARVDGYRNRLKRFTVLRRRQVIMAGQSEPIIVEDRG